ncbi:RecQ family ATP-dependent DNA helicase [Xylophilus sp.]|uniref:RecQ family ATP-dependent DNA helicase n=1 Tax=Xylophilus sp. TaxID=2653893 RepID=UPI0013B824C2|nr:RecQ family ATP-dependent DNA helicase [Xylophilus sp.]KAF1046022.1 MAG: ATP-dependent DNA helicase RecQ [Xylophilus sp.]
MSADPSSTISTIRPGRRARADVRPPSSRDRRCTALLREVFGLHALRPGQREVIDRVLRGESTLAIMPTGAGKSLCYQLPALVLPGLTVVVSPLIALMQDQCDALRDRGVRAVQYNSALPAAEARAVREAIAAGDAPIVLTTPEQLAGAAFQELLLASGKPVSLLVVDEAHCISQWGHDFRPAFLEIAAARRALGDPPVLALTATAAGAVARDIRQQLSIAAAGTVNTGSYRPNLDYRVEAWTKEKDKRERVVALVRQSEGAGLVYCATVRAAEAVRDALAAADVPGVGLYHGRLPPAQRQQVQQDFMDGRLRVVVATNAFGLGIDRQDIRFVVHYQMPGGLDAYYQESGRAGRDGGPAACTLLFLRSDRAVQQFFLAGRYPSADDLQALYHALQTPAPTQDGWTPAALAGQLHRPLPKLEAAAGLLRRHRIAARSAGGGLRLRRTDLGDERLASMLQAYTDKRAQDRAALEAMVHYAQTGACRWQVLLQAVGHGGQDEVAACGHCDNCRRIAAASAEAAVSEADRAALQLPAAAADARGAATLSRRKRAGPFQPGEAVRVRRYGAGTVTAADASGVTVDFADGSQRIFQPDFVRRAAPAKTPATG